MGRPGKTLGQGIKENNREGNGGQNKADEVELIRGVNENQGAGDGQYYSLPYLDGSVGEFPLLRAWIEGVKFSIGQAIKSHGRASRPDHGDQNPEKAAKSDRMRWPGEGDGCERERQREDCVGETNEAAVIGNFGF